MSGKSYNGWRSWKLQDGAICRIRDERGELTQEPDLHCDGCFMSLIPQQRYEFFRTDGVVDFYMLTRLGELYAF